MLAPACASTFSAKNKVASSPSSASSADLVRISPQESFVWSVRWRGMRSGEIRTQVEAAPARGPRPTVVVRSQVGAKGFLSLFVRRQGKLITRMDRRTGLPVEVRDESMSPRGWSVTRASCSPHLCRFASAQEGEAPRNWVQPLPGGRMIHDLHSALAWLRAWDAERVRQASFLSVRGRRLYTVRVESHRSQRIRTPMGPRIAQLFELRGARLTPDLRIDPTQKPSTLRLWISVDDARLPLRFEAETRLGKVEAELTEYRAPRSDLRQWASLAPISSSAR